MTHYVKSMGDVTLFEGSVVLSIDDRVQLSDAQFATSEVQGYITSGTLIEITAEEAYKAKGDYPVVNSDRQLTQHENVSVDTTLGSVRLKLYPKPRNGTSHYVLPAKLTWETNHVRLLVANPSYPIMGQSDWYDLDVSVGVYIIFVGGATGWRVMPS